MAIGPTSLQETALFVRLKELEAAGQCQLGLAGNVKALCAEASDRLKVFPALHGQYTLHDEVHCLRVVHLMGLVLGPASLSRLNAFEISLLVLAAHFHDQGMIVEPGEIEKIRHTDEWQTHEQNWSDEHPNYQETVNRLADPSLNAPERDRAAQAVADLRAGMWTDYVRKSHGDRSATFVSERLGNDPRLTWDGRQIAPLLAQLCLSHVRSAESIQPTTGFRFNELIGTTPVNLAQLAFLLRLADILDFDRERTPESLFRSIHFTSPTSIQEWHKHRGIEGWEIGSTRILFTAEYDHPAYERATRQFLDYIDDELSSAHIWNDSLPAPFQSSRINVPQKVDRHRIGPRLDALTRQPLYRYVDLEISISRDEIVKLLMTERLYSHSSLFIRELLQNGLDALRHREALFKSENSSPPKLHVEFQHYLESGFDVVQCIDNGVGMDEQIVHKFLTRAGRSYYRSAEFERERARFRDKGCDFDPCAKFGIGFMSCFMFGDDITIRTRKDYGAGRSYGPPLVVEIKGLSSIIVIRPGDPNQPVGTSVEIRGREKSFAVDRWNDPVRLVETIEGYALAAEYSISAVCDVPMIAGQTTITPALTPNPGFFEGLDTESKKTYLADFGEADPQLRGQIRLCMLTDAAGVPTVANDDYRIERDSKTPHRRVVIDNAGVYQKNDEDATGQLCCDGILVAGAPGGRFGRSRLGYQNPLIRYDSTSYLLDVRGELKPTLTPARRVPEYFFSRPDHTWTRLSEIASKSYTTILDDILADASKAPDPLRAWLVIEAYGLELSRATVRQVWDCLSIPVMGPDGLRWIRLRDTTKWILPIGSDDDKLTWLLRSENGDRVCVPKEIRELQENQPHLTPWLVSKLVLGMSDITATAEELRLTVKEPQGKLRLSDFSAGTSLERRWFFPLEGELADVISVVSSDGFANSRHEVTSSWKASDEKPWSRRTPLERIHSRLAWGAVGDPFNLPSTTVSKWSRRLRKELGVLARNVHWDSVPKTQRPPFAIFRAGSGKEYLTLQKLFEWADDNIDDLRSEEE